MFQHHPPLSHPKDPQDLKNVSYNYLIQTPPHDHHPTAWGRGGGLDFRNIRFERPLALWSWITCCALFSEEGGGEGIWKHKICRYVELLCYIFPPPPLPQPARILNPSESIIHIIPGIPNRHVRSQSLWEDWCGRKAGLAQTNQRNPSIVIMPPPPAHHLTRWNAWLACNILQ